MEDKLDEKLKETLHRLASSFYYEGSSAEWFDKEVPEWSAKLKQAFKDAGYVQIPNVVRQQDSSLTVNGKEVMTGQEWYTYLEDLAECDCESHINQVCDKCQIIKPFLHTARKASGLE